MEKDMIERIAKRFMLYDINLPGAGDLRGTLQLRYGVARELAMIAIEAMREPTEAQYEALSATDKMWRELDSKTVWQTYIDAALQPRAPITVG